MVLTTLVAAGSWWATWLARDLPGWAQLLVATGAAGVVYAVVVLVVAPLRRDLLGVLSIVRGATRRVSG